MIRGNINSNLALIKWPEFRWGRSSVGWISVWELFLTLKSLRLRNIYRCLIIVLLRIYQTEECKFIGKFGFCGFLLSVNLKVKWMRKIYHHIILTFGSLKKTEWSNLSVTFRYISYIQRMWPRFKQFPSTKNNACFDVSTWRIAEISNASCDVWQAWLYYIGSWKFA